MGHEYVGVVTQIGDDVRTLEVGDYVVGSFVISDNTCEICLAGYQSKCVHAEFVAFTVGEGWFAAVAAEAGRGKTVAVVGDGAVGLMGVLAAKELGAERIIISSRHADRQALARDFGATDVLAERGEAFVEKVKELTNRFGAHSVVEAVGTAEAFTQARKSVRPGGHVGFVGLTHDVQIPGDELFFDQIHLRGGPAPVRRFLPELIKLIWDRKIDLGKVFDLTLPLEEAAEGYRAMDERRATKVLLTV